VVCLVTCGVGAAIEGIAQVFAALHNQAQQRGLLGERGRQVTKEGIDEIEEHLKKNVQGWDMPYNRAAVQRLRDGHRTTEDLNFYAHDWLEKFLMEAKDVPILGRIDYSTAHRWALRMGEILDDALTPTRIYARDVIREHAGWFSRAQRNAVGLD
jgi:hypothetical protein